MDYKDIRDYVAKCHDEANCQYDGQPYIVHIDMVVGMVSGYGCVFIHPNDTIITIKAAFCHDLIEDTTQSFNDVTEVIGKDAANIVLAVTDVTAENRLMKHLLTMGKTVTNYRAIVLKMCDIYANAMYSREHGSSMYKKYVEEYAYRKPIFNKALTWYKNELDQDILKQLWAELDFAHDIQGTYTGLKSLK